MAHEQGVPPAVLKVCLLEEFRVGVRLIAAESCEAHGLCVVIDARATATQVTQVATDPASDVKNGTCADPPSVHGIRQLHV